MAKPNIFQRLSDSFLFQRILGKTRPGSYKSSTEIDARLSEIKKGNNLNEKGFFEADSYQPKSKARSINNNSQFQPYVQKYKETMEKESQKQPQKKSSLSDMIAEATKVQAAQIANANSISRNDLAKTDQSRGR